MNSEGLWLNYDETIEKLIGFVDAKYVHTTARDIYKAFTILIWMVTILVLLFVLVVGYLWTVSLVESLPIMISFAALMIAANSTMMTIRKIGERRLLRLHFERLYPLLAEKSEEVKHLLLPLVAMKMENPRMSLHVLYEMDKTLFQKDKVLDFYLHTGK